MTTLPSPSRHRRARNGRTRGRAHPVLPVLLAALVLSVVAGCTDDTAAPGDVGSVRKAALGKFVDQFAVPGVERAGRDADALRRSVDELCATPDASTLRAARAAAVTAWRSWERLAAVDFGPVSERRSMSFVNYPVDMTGVDEQLASGPPADADAARNRLASGRRGFGAIEHLLVGEPGSPFPPESFDAPRCTYLRSLAALVLEEAAGVEHGWNAGPSGGLPYRSTAMGIGDGSLSNEELLNLIVNGELNRLEAASKALTKAAEAEGDPSQPAPGRLFAIAAMLDGIADSERRLAPMLSPSLARRVEQQVAKASATLDEYAARPTEERPPTQDLEAAAEAVESLRQTISTEVVSALDVTVGFSDNDGDS